MKCSECQHWESASAEWGYCTQITESSEYLGANTQLVLDKGLPWESIGEVWLETKADFYCKLFEESNGKSEKKR
jgi:hypothetical protein